MFGPFEKMFDLNRDGKLDVVEEAMMYDFLSSTSQEEDDEDEDLDDDPDDDLFDDADEDEDDFDDF